ncbi:serine hydrolase [Modestobacter versicolor]|nr:serine hydrolase [Modestobacter versicolor]MBB3676893.1 hypothetical protein [Modestobacter versicolor]
MASRALIGTACVGALVAALLVSPALCFGSAAQEPAAVGAAEATVDVEPVPRAFREDADRVPPVPPIRAVDEAAVLSGVDAAAAPASTSVGAVVLDPQGRTLLQTSDAARPLPSASLVKLLVVQQLLARPAPGGWDSSTWFRMQRAVTVSDDAAMNVLWTRYDGPALVRAAVAEFGLSGTAPPTDPSQWGQATTTAADVGRFLSALTATPSSLASATLLAWMRGAAPTAADGFDQRFGLLSGPAGPGVAAKQGWMCCVDGRRQLHSAGVLDDGRVVVVLGEGSAARPWSQVEAAVDGATAALVAGTR